MAEYSAPSLQLLNPGQSVIFATTTVPCERGFIMHRENSGAFILSGYIPYCNCCQGSRNAQYLVDFGANVCIPEGGTVDQITVAFTLDGSELIDSIMQSYPTAAEQFNNISRAITVPVFNGCCELLRVTNMSTVQIGVANANIIFTRPDLVMSR